MNTRDHWSKTKQGRATACKELGIASCVVQSVRQQHDEPSPTVLASALSAIIGAVWLDLEKQNASSANTRANIFRILRHIDAVMAGTTGSTLSITEGQTAPRVEGSDGYPFTTSEAAPNVIPPMETPVHPSSSIGTFPSQLPSGMFHGALGNLDMASLPINGVALDADFVLLNDFQRMFFAPGSLNCTDAIEAAVQSASILDPISSVHGDASNSFRLWPFDGTVGQPENEWQIETGGMAAAPEVRSDGVGNVQTTVTLAKRKCSHNGKDKHHAESMRCALRVEREKLNGAPDLEVLLHHPLLEEIGADPPQQIWLRFLYLAIGSGPSLIDFKEQFHSAKERSVTGVRTIGPILTHPERFQEICRLEGEEALCALRRRYHVIKLCETERDIFLQNNQMIMETPYTFDAGHRSLIGNPAVMQEAALTDALLFKIRPELRRETPDFQKFRRRIKRVRRLAKILQMLTGTYGFGILAMLPSGPSYLESPLTDNV